MNLPHFKIPNYYFNTIMLSIYLTLIWSLIIVLFSGSRVCQRLSSNYSDTPTIVTLQFRSSTSWFLPIVYTGFFIPQKFRKFFEEEFECCTKYNNGCSRRRRLPPGIHERPCDVRNRVQEKTVKIARCIQWSELRRWKYGPLHIEQPKWFTRWIQIPTDKIIWSIS